MGKRIQISHISIVLFLIIFTCCDEHHHHHVNCARHTQFLKVKPQSNINHDSPNPNFLGFLPKGVPIPPSGPSQRHNAIGLDASEARSP
ncbi:hypothetical protein ACP275_03G090900 [Erythranthe tilingii]